MGSPAADEQCLGEQTRDPAGKYPCYTSPSRFWGYRPAATALPDTRVVSWYFNYYAVPGNLIRLGGFRLAVCRLWRQALKRRSQRNRLQWSRYGRLADLYIPRLRNAHPYPEDRFASRTQGRSRMR